ncbi:MAG: glycosyltransferase family 4 protein, partial [Pyrobaculum sp.]
MRILHVFDDYYTPGERALAGQGSIPTAVYYLAKYAAERHDVTILERGKALPEEEYIDGIRYVRIKKDRLPAPPYNLIKTPAGLMTLVRDSVDMARRIAKHLKREDYDIIHFHFPFAAAILTLDRDIRKKAVYTAHVGSERKRFALDNSAPLLMKLFSPDLHLAKKAAKTVLLNHPLREKLIAKGIPPERLEVIPLGVEVDEYNVPLEEVERVKKKYGLNGVVVMFAGTVTPRKGVEYLVKAAELINRRDVIFLIVGNLNMDRQYADRLIQYVRE